MDALNKIKNTVPLFFRVLLYSLIITACNTNDKGNSKSLFNFQQSQLGGGGFIDGIYQIPEDSNIVYARSDVGGVYKSMDAGKSFIGMNRGLELGYQHCVASFAINPFNSNEMLRCSGEPRNHQIYGAVHKSVDAGKSWKEVSNAVDFIGNGDMKQLGEKIAYDPFNKGVVVTGGITKGLYISNNHGDTWNYASFKNEPIAFVAFNPYLKNRLYVAIANHMPFNGYITDTNTYKQPVDGKLYLSKDNGKSFELIHTLKGFMFGKLTFNKFSPKSVYAACLDKGLQKSTDEGHHFSPIMNGLPPSDKIEYITLDADQNQKDILYTVARRLPYRIAKGNHDAVPLVPLYRSVNGGESWQLIKELKMQDMSLYPGYIKSIDWIGWAIDGFSVSIHNSNKLFMSNWYGLSVSNNGGQNWCGNNFKGIENTCIENIVADPITLGKAYFVLPDHYPLFTTDAGISYKQFFDTTVYLHSSAVAASKFNPLVILYGAKDEWNPKNSVIMRSNNGGKSFSIAMKFPNSMTVQSLKEDYFTPGRFYAYIDRSLNDGAGLYRTDDYGITWNKLPLVLPTYIKTLPHHANWIENELLSVTLGQVKNVCGTNQLLCVDSHKKDRIYFGEWTEGIYCSDDAGKTWQTIGTGLPFHKDTTAVLVDIKVDPTNSGVLYAGFVHEGLWKSIDYGKSFTKLFPTDNRIFNASSIVVGGYNAQEIFVASDPLTWSPSPSAIYYSNNAGKSWMNIYDGAFGALRWKGIAVDHISGNLYGVTSGNGAFYANRTK